MSERLNLKPEPATAILRPSRNLPNAPTPDDCRIGLPGAAQGVSPALAQLCGRIVEAGRVLAEYADQLSLHTGQSGIAQKGQNGQHWQKGKHGQNVQNGLTPLTPSKRLPHLVYKREDRTITRAYKVRGAVVGMSKAIALYDARRFLTVSTGNHALGVLKAAELLRPKSVRIVVPTNTAEGKLTKIEAALAAVRQQGVRAELVKVGRHFDEARLWALARETESGEFYLDPYNDPWVVAGQGTIGLELIRQLEPLLLNGRYEEVLLVSPVGGGGLLTGTATALTMASAWEPAFRNIKLRFAGLYLSDLDADMGDAIRVAEMAAANRAVLESLQVHLSGMADHEMRTGVRFVEQDLQQRVEGASGGTLYPILHTENYHPTEKRLVVSLLSGANVTV